MKDFLGELIGSFIMVFVGLATVVNAALIGSFSGLLQVAVLWGLGLVIAITISGPMSGAHLNPAITLAFARVTDFSWKKVPRYIIAQCLGSLIAAILVYILYSEAIYSYESLLDIERGSFESVRSAMVFGEYYPNPAMVEDSPLSSISILSAFLAEAIGTGILAYVIFTIIKLQDLPKWLIPILIGVTLTILISLFAPLSMAGFNPARDFMPRLLSVFLGWGTVPFMANGIGWLVVYILAPIIGAQIGAAIATNKYLQN